MGLASWEFWLATSVTAAGGVSFGFSADATGTETSAGTGAVAFGFSVAAVATETVSGTDAVAFSFSEAASGAETETGTAAEQFSFSLVATGSETLAGTAELAFGFAVSAEGTGGAVATASPAGHRFLVRNEPPVRRPRITGAGGATFGFDVVAEGDVDDDDLSFFLLAA